MGITFRITLLQSVIPKGNPKKVIPKMPKLTKPLTDKEIKAASPKEKAYNLFDGGGLYMEIPTKQSKRWRLKYRFEGKGKLLSLGTYPQISLQDARKLRVKFKEQIAKGIDPAEERKQKKEEIHKEEIIKQEEETRQKNTFESVTDEWLTLQESQMAVSTLKNRRRALEFDFYPAIGKKPIDKITRKDLIAIATDIQARGAIYTAHRMLTVCNQIWRYALQKEYIERNIVNDISKKDILIAAERKNFRTITDPQRIGELMKAIDSYPGEPNTKAALQILSMTFPRPANIRFAEWSEFDLKKKVWTIPAEKMKMRKAHAIPLPSQAVKILKELYPLTKDAKYVFHSGLGKSRAMSENTLNAALKRLDFGSEIVSHGFRAMFSTLAYESGLFRGEVIEDLLAHQEKNEIKRAYNRAAYEKEKRELMQWWADFLEGVKNG